MYGESKCNLITHLCVWMIVDITAFCTHAKIFAHLWHSYIVFQLFRTFFTENPKEHWIEISDNISLQSGAFFHLSPTMQKCRHMCTTLRRSCGFVSLKALEDKLHNLPWENYLMHKCSLKSLHCSSLVVAEWLCKSPAIHTKYVTLMSLRLRVYQTDFFQHSFHTWKGLLIMIVIYLLWIVKWLFY